jgi:hypothetical protein
VNCSRLLERRATTKWGKLAPSLRVAAQIRGPRRQVFAAGVEIRGPRRQVVVAGVEIGPYFVVVLGGGPATVVVLRLVWPDFRSQRCSPQ